MPVAWASVTDFGATPGSGDCTAAINNAETTLAAQGGGVLTWPAGTFTAAGINKLANITWLGSGRGATVIQAPAAAQGGAVVQTSGAYSLFGSGSLAGQSAFGIRDILIDGNKAAGAKVDGLAVYGAVYDLSQVEVQNCSGVAARSEYGIPGAVPGGHGYCAQSSLRDLWLHDCDNGGLYFGGPDDTSVVNMLAYRNLNFNIDTYGSGSLKIINSHVWGSAFDGRQAAYGFIINSPGTTLTNCHAEGSTSCQVIFNSSNCSFLGGMIYDDSQNPNSSFGICIGGPSPVSNCTINTNFANCQAGAILFNNDGGNHSILAVGSTTKGYGFSGNAAGGSFIRLHIAGATYNAQLTAG